MIIFIKAGNRKQETGNKRQETRDKEAERKEYRMKNQNIFHEDFHKLLKL